MVYFQASTLQLLPGILFIHRMFEDVLNLSSTGPSTWCKDCPIASAGKRQSPVDLPRFPSYDSNLRPPKVTYTPFSDAKLLNNGHSVQFQPGSDNSSGNTKRVLVCTEQKLLVNYLSARITKFNHTLGHNN